MASLSVGIVGLPNVGKSTLFNALLQKQQAAVANYPFTTIKPNVGVVPLPDLRLRKLAQATKKAHGLNTLPPQVPATIRFVDIAGLVKNAHQGEGLGNQFLAHIREVDLVCHVLRNFSDLHISQKGSARPVSDLQIVRTELTLADLATLEKQKSPRGKVEKTAAVRWQGICKLVSAVSQGKLASQAQLTDEEKNLTNNLFLITAKPELFILNTGESDLAASGQLIADFAWQAHVDPRRVLAVCAKLETELSALSPAERIQYQKELGIKQSGLEKLIQTAFGTLSLISFYTATGFKEVRSWPIKSGTSAFAAAGLIHADFQKEFLKAAVVSFEDFVSFGAWPGCKQAGKIRYESKDYQIHEGEVVEFQRAA